jgi:hypothetical protein
MLAISVIPDRTLQFDFGKSDHKTKNYQSGKRNMFQTLYTKLNYIFIFYFLR